MNNLSALKERLEKGNFTCVLSDGQAFLESTQSGVRPLLEFIASGKNFKGFCAADKIVGAAAAFLYAYMGVRALYAEVVSERAAEICKEYNIELSYGQITQKIINRAGTGMCPMEEAVKDISDPEEALKAIKEKLIKLKG